MTAEVIVMNKLAVAAAADSAVTISVAGGQKIYQSANKLFGLGNYLPVGIMVYGNAEFMSVPWETIVKTYRSYLATKTFPHVEDYARHFIGYLERDRNLFPSDAQERFVEGGARSYLSHFGLELRDKLSQTLKDQSDIPEPRVAQLVASLVSSTLDDLRRQGTADGLPARFPRTVAKRYSAEFTRAIEAIFGDIPLSRASAANLRRVLAEVFYRDVIGNPSGIVIMGFGAEDVFPKAFEYLVRGMVANRLWRVPKRSQAVSRDKAAAIIPFAQSEMVSTFMEGIDPELAGFLMGMFGTLLTGYIDQVAEALPGSEPAQKEEFKKRVAAVCSQQLQQLEEGFDKYRMDKHVSPIMNMIGALPKEELARVAEALVNLTSFKRRVSAQEETVAEPIDVAVISRGDGFVWVKRKHYFPPELNPGWAQRLTGDINA